MEAAHAACTSGGLHATMCMPKMTSLHHCNAIDHYWMIWFLQFASLHHLDLDLSSAIDHYWTEMLRISLHHLDLDLTSANGAAKQPRGKGSLMRTNCQPAPS
eukprot:912670-Lingulodinium_polyedra.AAC.1